jgi:bacterioferritin
MRNKSRAVALLNEVLVAELTAINQYFLGSKLAAHHGYGRLHERLRQESIEEMKHADRLMDRILTLGGVPNLQKLEKIRVGESVLEQLRADAALEGQAVERLRQGATALRGLQDHASAALLDDLLGSAEGHAEWLETQLRLAEELGEAAYLAQQIRA